MDRSLASLAHDKRLIAYTAAAMYGGAALDELMTGFIPGDPPLDLFSELLAGVIVTLLVVFGPRLPRLALAALGPVGVLLIANALAGAPPTGDAAVLYTWPVIWMSFFFGWRGAAAIVATIALAHAAVLLSLPAGRGYPGRWVAVMISVSVVAAVVVRLARHNERLLARVAGEARVDALTGLANRRGFEERAVVELARARRSGAPIALAVFDVDHFKRINDELGHDVGDRVLAQVAALLARDAADIDVVARLGGDEFVALLAGCDAAEAGAFAERVRHALAAEQPQGAGQVRLSAGIDAALAPERIEAMLVRADLALYDAKRTGRDRAVVFEHRSAERDAAREPQQRSTRGASARTAAAPHTRPPRAAGLRRARAWQRAERRAAERGGRRSP